MWPLRASIDGAIKIATSRDIFCRGNWATSLATSFNVQNGWTDLTSARLWAYCSFPTEVNFSLIDVILYHYLSSIYINSKIKLNKIHNTGNFIKCCCSMLPTSHLCNTVCYVYIGTCIICKGGAQYKGQTDWNSQPVHCKKLFW